MDALIVICLTVCFLALLAARYFNPVVNEELIDKREHTFSETGDYYYTEYWFRRTYKNGAIKIVRKTDKSWF